MKRRKTWPWLLALLMVLGVGGVLVKRSGAGPTNLDSSLIVTVKRGDLPIEVIETGKVQPREKVEIKSKVAGQVLKVAVEEGQKVKRGQLLIRLDPIDYQREVERCEADLAQAKIALEYADLMHERRKKGLAERAVAQSDLDFAANDAQAKKVAVDRAKVALDAAKDKLRYTEITAPLEGTIIEKGIQPGEVVTPGVQQTYEGKALLTVADVSTLLVRADLNQIDVAKVTLGQSVTLTLDALPGKSYEAKITKIAPASTQPKGKDVDVFPTEATLTQADGLIKPGMTADVRIHVDKKLGVLSLPIEAIVKESGKSFVQKVVTGADGKPKTEKKEIKPGARNDREVEIAEGLAEGDRVLIKPASSADNEMKM